MVSVSKIFMAPANGKVTGKKACISLSVMYENLPCVIQCLIRPSKGLQVRPGNPL